MSDYASTLREILSSDGRYLVMTAENRAPIRALIPELGERFIDTGITEQTLVGMAAGLALRGRVPIAHALSAFLTMRAFEFIRTDIGIGKLPVKLVGFVPGLLSDGNGPTHQALEDVSLMRGVPGMQVFCPADLEDLCVGLPHVLATPSPTYIRYIARPAICPHSDSFEVGQAEVLSRGSDVTLLVYGTLFTEAFQAARLLRAQGFSVGLLNMRMLQPLDDKALLAVMTETRALVSIEDHFLIGGLHSLLAELMVRHQFLRPLLPIAFESRWFRPALFDAVIHHEKLNAEALADRIGTWLHSQKELDSCPTR